VEVSSHFSTSGSLALSKVYGIFEWVFAKSPEIRSVVNKASKYLHVLIYDIKHTSYNLLVFFKLYIGFKMYTFWIILIEKTCKGYNSLLNTDLIFFAIFQKSMGKMHRFSIYSTS